MTHDEARNVMRKLEAELEAYQPPVKFLDFELTALDYAHALAADISAQTGEHYIVKDDDGHPLIVSAEPTCYELLEECRTVLRAMISAPTLARNAVPNAERMIERLDAALGGE